MVGDSTMKTVNSRVVEAALGGGLLTGRSASSQGSISHLAGHPGRAYNSVSSYPGSKFPQSSFELVVPRLLSNHVVTNLVLQSPTSDLTNLKGLPEVQQQDLVKQSACNMVKIMDRARAEHPSLRKVVILDQLPRSDTEELCNLSKLYNATLREQVAAAPDSSHCQMQVASHDSLHATSQDMRSDLFGSPSARGTDGIHFRGKKGSKLHTSSIISALKTAGLGDWRSAQSCPRDGSQQEGRTFSQAVRTSNRYEVLNC
jgi:hypothetical protein